MANDTKSAPQVVAPNAFKQRRADFGKSIGMGKKIVRKFVDENLLKTRQHRGGVK